MKLKHRLSLYAVFIFSIVIITVSVVIYVWYYQQMEKMEQEGMQSKTLLAAIYYLEKDELSSLEHENIKTQLLKSISRKNIVVFDEKNKQFGGGMVEQGDISKEYIEQVRRQRNASFASKSFFYHGIYYEDNQGDFVVITRESKEEFDAQMQSLLQILIIVSLLGIVFVYLFSQYLGYIAYDPVVKIIAQIKERDTKNFNEPLVLNQSYAEIEDLIITYNHFINRIAQTFHVQKNFIDYVSHELRTPITALLGTLEVTTHKRRDLFEYEQVIAKLKQYTNDLQETLDHMMLLSGAKTNFEFKPVRVDEVIWQVIENAVLYHGAKIEVDIQVKDTQLLRIKGNDKLLELAIGNIIENAIKYSDNQSIKVLLEERQGQLVVTCIDQGIGIPEGDLDNIMQNFYRGQNTQKYQGKGIGLSMANIIFLLHQVSMQIHSDLHGTKVRLLF